MLQTKCSCDAINHFRVKNDLVKNQVSILLFYSLVFPFINFFFLIPCKYTFVVVALDTDRNSFSAPSMTKTDRLFFRFGQKIS